MMFSLNSVFVINNWGQISLTFIFTRGCDISLRWIPRGSLLIQEHALCWRLWHMLGQNKSLYVSSIFVRPHLLPSGTAILNCCLSDRHIHGRVLFSFEFLWLLVSLNIPSYVEKCLWKNDYFFWERNSHNFKGEIEMEPMFIVI